MSSVIAIFFCNNCFFQGESHIKLFLILTFLAEYLHLSLFICSGFITKNNLGHVLPERYILLTYCFTSCNVPKQISSGLPIRICNTPSRHPVFIAFLPSLFYFTAPDILNGIGRMDRYTWVCFRFVF